MSCTVSFVNIFTYNLHVFIDILFIILFFFKFILLLIFILLFIFIFLSIHIHNSDGEQQGQKKASDVSELYDKFKCVSDAILANTKGSVDNKFLLRFNLVNFVNFASDSERELKLFEDKFRSHRLDSRLIDSGRVEMLLYEIFKDVNFVNIPILKGSEVSLLDDRFKCRMCCIEYMVNAGLCMEVSDERELYWRLREVRSPIE